MARKRTEFGPDVELRIKALLARGGTTESISQTLTRDGVRGASPSTIQRRVRELRTGTTPGSSGRLPASSAADAHVPVVPVEELPGAPEEIPEGTDIDTFDRWIATAEKLAKQAEADKNFVELGKAGRLVVMLLDAKRKATPPQAPDPNENPDLKALAEDVAKRLHNLVDQVTGE